VAGGGSAAGGGPERAALLRELADLVMGVQAGLHHVVRVAVDGPDAAGKSTFADALAAAVRMRGHSAIRASIDGFHRPRAERHARGELSSAGYYLDSFDLARLRADLLEPLGPAGSGSYRAAAFDHESDRPVAEPVRIAAARSVLVVDGVFLLRPELRDCWEVAVYLDANDSEILERALARDTARMGGADAVRERYVQRYLPAQRRYERDVDPRGLADVVIENSDPSRPVVTRRRAR
jgi:uridine kinase